MNRYNPNTDLVFRKLLGSDEIKDMPVSLINSIVDCHYRITDLPTNNSYTLATYVDGKTCILDIKVLGEHSDLRWKGRL